MDPAARQVSVDRFRGPAPADQPAGFPLPTTPPAGAVAGSACRASLNYLRRDSTAPEPAGAGSVRKFVRAPASAVRSSLKRISRAASSSRSTGKQGLSSGPSKPSRKDHKTWLGAHEGHVERRRSGGRRNVDTARDRPRTGASLRERGKPSPDYDGSARKGTNLSCPSCRTAARVSGRRHSVPGRACCT